jgi:acylphosphatase
MKQHLDIMIFGRVQGVSFRWSAKEKADCLGVCGYAENRSDGSVHLEAEGEEQTLAAFTEWCRHGPPLASVERVEVNYAPLKNYRDFSLR